MRFCMDNTARKFILPIFDSCPQIDDTTDETTKTIPLQKRPNVVLFSDKEGVNMAKGEVV